MTPAIVYFTGAHRFLSNFWPAPVEFEGLIYTTVEHAYVAAKTTDQATREHINQIASAGDVKRYGRKIKMRSDWDGIKLELMGQLVRRKFEHADLAKLLLATGDAELVEGNHWGDRFWGVCNGHGQNHLGKILMQVRAELASPASVGTGGSPL